MRAATLAVLLLAAAAPQPAAADPVQAAICVENSILLDPPLLGAMACLQGALGTEPLCLQVYDAGTDTLRTFPCLHACDSIAPPTWAVSVGVDGAPGDSVTGTLACGGSPAVEATATATAAGAGVGREAGTIPDDLSAMSCGSLSPPPATVGSYAVVCRPAAVLL